MNAKLERELAVYGHAGGSLWEVSMVVSSLPLVLGAFRSQSSLISNFFLLLLLPVLFAHTSLPSTYFPFGLFGYTFVLFCIAVLFHHAPTTTTRGENDSPPGDGGKLTLLRATTVLSTVICILAVDFPVLFPREYCKTEWQGTGLMDLGVGAYVVTGALSRSNSRKRGKFASGKIIFVLVCVGLARLVVTRALDYQLHVGEYGLHWNFFFTLALTRLVSSTIPNEYCLYAGLFVLVAHQTALSNTVWGEWVMMEDDTRSSLFWQNKEGIISLPGYIALELLARAAAGGGSALKWSWPRLLTAHLALVSVLELELLPPVSRRSCNAGFVLWTLSIAFLIVFWQDALHLPSNNTALVRALSRNQLLVFLVANIGTGLVNLLTDTLHADLPTALLIMLVYLTLVCFAALKV